MILTVRPATRLAAYSMASPRTQHPFIESSQPAGVSIQEFRNRIKARLTAVHNAWIDHRNPETNHPPPPVPDVGSISSISTNRINHAQPSSTHMHYTTPNTPIVAYTQHPVTQPARPRPHTPPASYSIFDNSSSNSRCKPSCLRFSNSGPANFSRLCPSSSASSSSSLTPVDDAGVNGAVPECRKSTSITPCVYFRSKLGDCHWGSGRRA